MVKHFKKRANRKFRKAFGKRKRTGAITRAKGKYVHIKQGQVPVFDLPRHQLLPNSIFIRMYSKITGYLATAAAVNGYADVKLNSVQLPWNATAGQLFSTTGNGFNIGSSESTALANLDPWGYPAINTLYRRFLVHQAKITAQFTPQGVDDVLQVCICPMNSAGIVSTNDTVGEMSKSPFSKTIQVSQANGKYQISNRIRPRDFLGVTSAQYEAGKVPLAAADVVGPYSGGTANDPTTVLLFRTAYQVGDNEVLAADIPYTVELEYAVEWFRLPYEVIIGQI